MREEWLWGALGGEEEEENELFKREGRQVGVRRERESSPVEEIDQLSYCFPGVTLLCGLALGGKSNCPR